MKSRLSSTIRTLALVNGIVALAVIGLAYSAGRQSGGANIFDSGNVAGCRLWRRARRGRAGAGDEYHPGVATGGSVSEPLKELSQILRAAGRGRSARARRRLRDQ